MDKVKQALDEYSNLPLVTTPDFWQKDICDFVYSAQFEVDLYEGGDSEGTKAEINKVKKFIAKWDGKCECGECDSK